MSRIHVRNGYRSPEPLRPVHFRCPISLWAEVQASAQREHVKPSHIIRLALDAVIGEGSRAQPAQDRDEQEGAATNA